MADGKITFWYLNQDGTTGRITEDAEELTVIQETVETEDIDIPASPLYQWVKNLADKQEDMPADIAKAVNENWDKLI